MAKTTPKKRSASAKTKRVAAKSKPKASTASKSVAKKAKVSKPVAAVQSLKPTSPTADDTQFARVLFALLCLAIVLIGAYFVIQSQELEDEYYESDSSATQQQIRKPAADPAE